MGRIVLGLMVLLAASCSDARVTTGSSEPNGSDDVIYQAELTVLEAPEHGPELCYMVLRSLPPQCRGLPVDGWEWSAVAGAESINGTTWGSYHVEGTFDGTTFHLLEASPSSDAGGDGGGAGDRDFFPACDEPDVVDPTHGVAEWEAMSQDYGPFEIPELVAVWVSDPAGEWDGPCVGNVVVRPGGRDAAIAAVREHYLGPLCVIERDGPTLAELEAVQAEMTETDVMERLRLVSASPDSREGAIVAQVWVADDETVALAHETWGGELVRLVGILQPVS